jgi:hypothetical protein
MKLNILIGTRGTLPLAMGVLALAAGCRTVSKGLTESVLERAPSREWRVHYGSRIQYTLTNETLLDVEFEGTRDADGILVRYPWGLASQAQCIADMTAGLLRQVSQRTGVTIATRTTLYLLRLDHRPQDFDILLTAEPNELPLPLFFTVGQESCEAILAHSRSFPYLLVHELVETSLAGGANGARVLPDLAWGLPGLRLHINNYTRWFRDGLANYAGYLAYEVFGRDLPGEQRLAYRETLVHANPFSSLAQVRDRLFRWPQSADMESERLNYNAALGLFLLIADTHGEQAIRDILHELAGRQAVDGSDLIAITNRVLGCGVKRLARDFTFPKVDIELEAMTPALALNRGLELREGLVVVSTPDKSAARRAGLRSKDVITAVGSVPVGGPLDFELGLFKARRQQSVPLTVQRVGAGTLTLELPLKGPPAPDPTLPGKRHNPLEKGRIELTPVVPLSGH